MKCRLLLSCLWWFSLSHSFDAFIIHDSNDEDFCDVITVMFIFDERQADSTSYHAHVEFAQTIVQTMEYSRVSLVTLDSSVSRDLRYHVIFHSVTGGDLTKDAWHRRNTSTMTQSELRDLCYSLLPKAVVIAVNLSLTVGRFLREMTISDVSQRTSYSRRNVNLKFYEIHTAASTSYKRSKSFRETPQKWLAQFVLFMYKSPINFYQEFNYIYDDMCRVVFVSASTETYFMLGNETCNRWTCYEYLEESTSAPEVEARFKQYTWTLKVVFSHPLDYHKRQPALVDWGEARRSCTRQGMSLLTVRSEREAQDFSQYISLFLTKVMLGYLPQVGYLSVIIGLSRNRKSVGQRFAWGETRDLLFSHWAPEEPRERLVRGCAEWAFHRANSSVNWTDARWQSTGCGTRSATVIACHHEVSPPVSYLNYSLDSLPKVSDITELGAFGEVYLNDVTYHLSKVISMSTAVATGFLFEEVIMMGNVIIRGLLRDETLTVTQHNFEELHRKLLAMFHVCGDEDDSRSPTYGVPLSQVCDGVRDCPSGSDETICGDEGYSPCTPREFACTSMQCVPQKARCDLVKDCQDGTDELGCGKDCPHKKCFGGGCLPRPWFQDSVEDCVDGSDERVRNVKAKACAFLCNRTRCVRREMLNNSVKDCSGPEGPLDETLGSLESINCSQNGKQVFRNNWAPKCILMRDRFGEVIGCRNFQHLVGCKTFICPKGYAKCPDSFCIPLSYVQDGKKDCEEGEDEGQPMAIYRPGAFLCNPWRIQTVPLSVLCDGKADCKGGEDELDCGYHCPSGFICLAGAVSIFRYNTPKYLRDLSFINYRTRYLDLSGVKVSNFFSIYPAGHLRHLQTLKLSNCNLRTIHRHFHNANSRPGGNNRIHTRCKVLRSGDFRSVKIADLSMNKLLEVPQCSYLHLMITLEELNLSYNSRLSIVSRDSFLRFGHKLQLLDLSFTGIKHLDKDVFDYLPRLTRLSLKGTGLTAISFIFPQTIQYLNLEDTSMSDFHPDIFSKVLTMKELLSPTYKLCCPVILGPRIASHICKFSGDDVSSCAHLVRETSQRIALWEMAMFTIVGNIITLVYRITWDRETLHKSYGLFVFNLCLSDLVMGVYLITIASADMLFLGTYVLHDSRWRNSPVCWTAGTAATLSSITSTLFVFLITVDRFLAVRFPYGDVRFTRRTMAGAVLAAWLFGGSAALVPLMPFARDWVIFSASGMCLGLPLGRERLPGWQYSATVFIGLNFTLFLLIGIGQLAIYKSIKDKNKETRKHMNKSSQLSQSQRLQEFAVAKQLSLVVISNFLCWFPIITMGLLALSGTDLGHTAFQWSAVLVLPFNSALNPFLYTLPVLKKKWADFKARRGEKKMVKAVSVVKQEQPTSLTLIEADSRKRLLLRCCQALSILNKEVILKSQWAVFTASDLDTLRCRINEHLLSSN